MLGSKEEYQPLPRENEALLNNERQIIQPGPRRRPTWLLLAIGYLVLTIINVSAIFYQARQHQCLPSVSTSNNLKKDYTYLDGDWPQELILREPLREMQHKFNDTPQFMDIFATDAHTHWESILPIGRGYIKLGQHPELFGITMYHQLHCLVRLRAVFAGENEDVGHVKHCFNYLREGIMCNADITLEPGSTIHNIGPDGVDHPGIKGGYGVQHKCKDASQVWNYLVDEWHRSFPDSDPMAHAAMYGEA